MPDLSLPVIAALAAVAAIAGLVDAIAGGGGLLTVPALMTAGLPPHFVFGTNKGSSVFGSFAALVRFWRAGLIDRPRVKLLFGFGLLGSLLGAALVLAIDPVVLKPLVLGLLVAAGVVVVFVRPAEGPRPMPERLAQKAALIALVIGAYDGFFGPGTGTFLILAFVSWLHFDLKGASANAKVVNFASNVAAVLVFATQGKVLWRVSIPMALGQLAGGTLGAQLAVRGGNRFIRVVVLLVVLSLVTKLAYDLSRS